MNTQIYINIMSFIYYCITYGVTDQDIVSEPKGGRFVKKNNVIRFKRFYDLIFNDLNHLVRPGP